MTNLSQSAQAVRDAALATYDKSIPKDDSLWALDRASVVAALRAAADQVVPEENVDEMDYDCLHAKWAASGRQDVRFALLAIATELKNQ